MNLDDVLGDPGLTRDRLFSFYVAVLKERIPDATIAPTPPESFVVTLLDGRTFTVYLENLWRSLRGLTTEDRIIKFETHVRGIYGMIVPTSVPAPTRQDIVPMIKDSEYFLVPDVRELVREHLAGDIWILYGTDSPDAIKTLRAKTFRKLGMSFAELRSLACDNLRRILPPIEQHGAGPWYLITAGGDYVASILLLDEVWASIEKDVNGDIVAAVPSRDVLLVTGSRSKEGIVYLRERARAIHETGDHLISQTLLRRCSGTWTVFE